MGTESKLLNHHLFQKPFLTYNSYLNHSLPLENKHFIRRLYETLSHSFDVVFNLKNGDGHGAVYPMLPRYICSVKLTR